MTEYSPNWWMLLLLCYFNILTQPSTFNIQHSAIILQFLALALANSFQVKVGFWLIKSLSCMSFSKCITNENINNIYNTPKRLKYLVNSLLTKHNQFLSMSNNKLHMIPVTQHVTERYILVGNMHLVRVENNINILSFSVLTLSVIRWRRTL